MTREQFDAILPALPAPERYVAQRETIGDGFTVRRAGMPVARVTLHRNPKEEKVVAVIVGEEYVEFPDEESALVAAAGMLSLLGGI